MPTDGCEPSLGDADNYRTPPVRVRWWRRTAPTIDFYQQFVRNVWRSSAMAQRGEYDGPRWSQTSHEVLTALESVGADVEVTGLNHLRRLKTPCVFVGNHMSMLETIVLPAIIQPICDVTFVVKQSLVDYPVFKHILRSRHPVAVTRENARDDFKTVMTEGQARLRDGISVVVFPQTTRSDSFDSKQFNTIGVKLAAKAGVPVIPIALRTDAWGNGKWLKDLGPIDASKEVKFAFGPPITIEGRGGQEHQKVVEFIQKHLQHWGVSTTG